MWRIKKSKIDVNEFAKKYNLSSIVAKIFINSNITKKNDINMFFNDDIEVLFKHHKMKNVIEAAKFTKECISQKKKILIVGDYDVDGIMSTYLLYSALKRCYAEVLYTIPERKDGYGINNKIIKAAIKNKINLVITCDNGIAAFEQMDILKKHNIDVIITDHHNIPIIDNKKSLPNATFIIDPKQNGDKSYSDICGTFVAFKFIVELFHLFNIHFSNYREYIPFVAIATICDAMPLLNENRIAVKNGLKIIKETNNVGLNELFEIYNLEDIDEYHIGFIIGPAINSASRLKSPKIAMHLLLTDNKDKAKYFADELKKLNEERKKLTLEGANQAIDIIENTTIKNDKIIVVYLSNILNSIAGIIAGRIKEIYNLPTIVFSKVGNIVKGSGRSIEQYNMFNGINECSKLLITHGGHNMAVGLSLYEYNLRLLRNKLNKSANFRIGSCNDIYIDAPIDISSVTENDVNQIETLKPFGEGFKKPLFADKNVKVISAVIVGKNKNVLKLVLEKKKKHINAIYFNDVALFKETVIKKYSEDIYNSLMENKKVNIHLDIAFYLSLNTWNNKTEIQLILKYFR